MLKCWHKVHWTSFEGKTTKGKKDTSIITTKSLNQRWKLRFFALQVNKLSPPPLHDFLLSSLPSFSFFYFFFFFSSLSLFLSSFSNLNHMLTYFELCHWIKLPMHPNSVSLSHFSVICGHTFLLTETERKIFQS